MHFWLPSSNGSYDRTNKTIETAPMYSDRGDSNEGANTKFGHKVRLKIRGLMDITP